MDARVNRPGKGSIEFIGFDMRETDSAMKEQSSIAYVRGDFDALICFDRTSASIRLRGDENP